MSTIEKTLESLDILEQLIKEYEIVLYNDDVNTFEYVIDALIDVCDHDPIQAEQCTMLVHYKGKCAVKTGSYEELEPRCSKLLELGLSAEIH
ncbi:ATP-dependent Clp protease adaptor ClpS [Wenyingzhuangia sp. 2_MG-2023]|uniref:ATP-dependent Clp protease adaptor ClpS n=1 Tax=Wenyingzhuangia sp. 2_MG-2023 TaxID=3062639 RepID=UPI0026E309B4|nr:ATP-dependent Clp protease adaptor ClpS [Wenyingzhuangia sp. 2_MG-2023]MDO6738506.1 ATP-dependent Clp protease adaptor ClpS [Wenyingzhuangia sp. 2_MG-2023]MDO6803271.1 ATP-dependent Clp protease adaptor ClpS [Wenyingzhuangia sp. 1_MG-2023]